MAERGFLFIADITGYTRFLTGSELDHAQGVLEDLFGVILERLKAPLALSNIQGDAFFAYSNDAAVWSPGQIFDSIEALYFGFHDRLASIVANTTCRCRACSNAGELDLKFIVHHGEYVSQEIAHRRELAGPDVILLHRLLKNDVAEQTGIYSYALFTAAAVEALDLDELNSGARPYTTNLEQFGAVNAVVVDLASRWADHHAHNEITVSDEELWLEPIERVLPFDAETVWSVCWDPDRRSRWNDYLETSVRVAGDPRRLRVGAVDHCAHGKQTFVMHYVDVRPLKHVTLEVALPMGGKLRRSASMSAEGDGTRICVRWARPEGPNPLATFVLRFVGSLLHRKRTRTQTFGELAMLEDYIAKSRASDFVAVIPASLSSREVAEAARKIATEPRG